MDISAAELDTTTTAAWQGRELHHLLKTQQKKYKELERINDWIDIINTQEEDNNIKIINNIDYLSDRNKNESGTKQQRK